LAAVLRTRAVEMTVALAEGWVKEATAHVTSKQPRHAAAASCYEKAIQIYRSIPHDQRVLHGIGESLVKLHRYMRESGARSLDELATLKVPPTLMFILLTYDSLNRRFQ